MAIVDIETTGGSAAFDRIIEIGVFVVEDGMIIESFETLINPERPIPGFITAMTGIKSSDVASEPLFLDIAHTLERLFRDAVFVAHNASFDYSFIAREFARIGRSFEMPRLCTVRLSRRLFPQYPRHNLDSIIRRFNLGIDRRHRAADDARMLYEFLSICESHHGIASLADAVQKISGVPPARATI